MQQLKPTSSAQNTALL